MASKDKLLANAQKFLSKGQLPKAISEYQKVVAADPKDVRNRQKLAELLSRDKRSEEALTEYEAVAKHYTDTGFYLKAIAVFKQMQKLEPSRVDIYHNLAELNEKQGLVGNALTEYRNLVSFYDKNEMHHESIEVLEKMLVLDPDNLNFSAKIAESYMAAGLTDDAFEKFSGIIESLSSQKEHVKVVKLFERFQGICPEETSARLPLAKALVGSGAAGKAIQILKGLLKNAPEDQDVNLCLTDAYVAEKDFSNARLTLNHLLKQKEDDLDLQEYYARICIDAAEPERARDHLEQWKDAFFQADRVASLQEFYEELKVLLPDDAVIPETLSVIYEAVGETGKLDKLDTPEPVETAATETADVALSDDLIDDVETLDMVGEEVSPDVEVPSLEADEPADLPAEKVAAKGIELDLDLDLDIAPPAKPAEDQKSEELPEEVAVAPEDSAEQEVEVEVEIDLDDMGDLELDIDLEEDGAALEVEEETDGLDFDIDVEEHAAEDDIAEPEADAVEEVEVEAESTELDVDLVEDGVALEIEEEADGLELDIDVEEDAAEDDVAELEAAVAEEVEIETEGPELDIDLEEDVAALEVEEESDGLELDADVEEGAVEGEGLELESDFAAPELDVTDVVDEPEAAEDIEVLEEIEELEEIEDIEEVVGLEPLEDIDEIEELEEVEELEPLEEIEEVEEPEEIEAVDEVAAAPDSSAQVDFTAALNVDAELEEAEFYLQQGLYDDAERVVQTLLEYRPGLQQLLEKLEDIKQARESAEAESDSTGFVDIMSDLQDDDLLAATDFLDSFGEDVQQDGDVSQKLVSELDSADTESHFDLGIAYKEMGLYEDAIAEFEKAGQDPVRKVDCVNLIGQCHMESGDTDAAMEAFRSGLQYDKLTDEGRMTLNFELGMLHQLNGQLLEALDYFQLVADKDSFFRDVGELIKNLRRELNLDDSDDDDGPQGNRDRVSYV